MVRQGLGMLIGMVLLASTDLTENNHRSSCVVYLISESKNVYFIYRTNPKRATETETDDDGKD